MKSNVFVTRFARKAALTSLAGVCLMPQDHVGAIFQPLPAIGSAATSGNRFQDPGTIATSKTENLTFSIRQPSEEWTKADEKKFRRLALKDSVQNITAEETRELNWLSMTRNHLLKPQSTEEVLLQIRRDRILEKMAETLREYVEFTETARNKGAAA